MFIIRISMIKNIMDAKQIKDEIGNLSKTAKTEIYRWIDEEAAADLLFRIGVREKRTEVQGDRSKKHIHQSAAP